ncbi:mannose-6-phosphate isomerase, class I [Haloechinothrix halophila]|uniref:mannose-6-phosphate isomerase, class I n=1 Tax=Haloechinothrix halophila TaxID=1069073 RepID=UPI00040F66DB|nr:mannose-6-phosphate isomerase, class I [Haloechinothrix halophila]
MELLHNAVRPYAWGSRTAIAELLGKPVPAPHPEAELWMGAHPGDPSRVCCSGGDLRSLCDVVSEDPEGALGASCARRWGGRLPFLLKVLAAEEPLSMQAHPTAAQAAEGYAREEAAGIPRDAPERNYPDPTAKPELVCALTEFEVLAGFADAARTVRLLRAIETPELAAFTDLLAGQPDTDGLRALFTTWITLPQQRIDDLLPDVLKSCARHAEARGEFAAECATVVQLGDEHPHDAGVLTSLLLNRIELGAGEALYLPAGNLHLYLRGTAVEILANSDNILRGGLTPKHVDVPELLRVVDFSRGSMPVLRGEPDGDPRLRVYRTDAQEFELSRVEWPEDDNGEVELPAGPQIVLCTRGGAVLRESSTGRELWLCRGESAWLAARDGAVSVRPTMSTQPAQLFRATAGPGG